MSNFWDFKVWGFVLLITALLGSLLVANILKKALPFLKNSSSLNFLTCLYIFNYYFPAKSVQR